MVVIKGNRQLTIQEEQLSEMLAKGYSRIDNEGKVVEVGQATTLKEIKAENDTLKAELAKYADAEKSIEAFEKYKAESMDKIAKAEALEAENVELKAQIEALNSQIADKSKK